MAIVTSPANHARLAHYQSISQRLGFAKGLLADQARALAQEGKAVVWIDGGLHANEMLGAQQLGEMVYQMVSRADPETVRLLDEVIIFFVHANPDGHELLAGWYMRNQAHGANACRVAAGCTTSTSATTTTATSLPQRSAKPKTSIARCTTNGCRSCFITITRVGRPAPCSGRRRSAIPTTTTSIPR